MKKNPYLISGFLVLLVSIGASGCGATSSTNASSGTSAAVSSATTNSSTSGQSSTSQQDSQAQQGSKASNPALQAAMSIRRLQNNSTMTLTTEQKTKLKTILQSLIDKTDPSQDFLQQQADAINAIFTDEQKSYLQQKPDQTKNNANFKGNPPQNSNSASNQDNKSNSGNGPSFNAQEIYQQLLKSKLVH